MTTIVCRAGVSDGAKAISELLGVRRVRPENVARSRATTVINWGCSQITKRDNQRVFNLPESVSASSNKVQAFVRMRDQGVNVPPFAFNNPQALRVRSNTIVVARTLPAASGGAGIVVVRPRQQFPQAPLYVTYIRKREEYRVHVAFGLAVLVVQKKKRNNAEPTGDEALIRNHGDHWVFCERDLGCDADGSRHALEEQAINAITAVGLHFGAVDVVRSIDDGRYYVLETNSKPGIVNASTATAYSSAFARRLQNE